MKSIYDKLYRGPIFKRWFRNWYVLEKGKGYSTNYTYGNWYDATFNEGCVFGPFWSENSVKCAAMEANNQNYHSMFS